MSLLQSVKSRLSTTHPKDELPAPAADSKTVDAIADLEQQLQAELRLAITALLQARSPTQQSGIYRQVAAELKTAGISYDSFQSALSAIYSDNQPDAAIITNNLSAHGYSRPEQLAAPTLSPNATLPNQYSGQN